MTESLTSTFDDCSMGGSGERRPDDIMASLDPENCEVRPLDVAAVAGGQAIRAAALDNPLPRAKQGFPKTYDPER